MRPIDVVTFQFLLKELANAACSVINFNGIL